MKRVLASKTGQLEMGGYTEQKTIEVFRFNEGMFRFHFLHDSTDECFETYNESMTLFKKYAKQLK